MSKLYVLRYSDNQIFSLETDGTVYYWMNIRLKKIPNELYNSFHEAVFDLNHNWLNIEMKIFDWVGQAIDYWVA